MCGKIIGCNDFSCANLEFYWHLYRFFFVRLTYFVRFTKICTNCSEIQNTLQVLNLRANCVNLRRSDKIVIFWIIWWENMLIWQRITCSDVGLSMWFCSKMNFCATFQFALLLLKLRRLNWRKSQKRREIFQIWVNPCHLLATKK